MGAKLSSIGSDVTKFGQILFAVCFFLVGCSSDSENLESENSELVTASPIAYIKRSISQMENYREERYIERYNAIDRSPLELTIPSEFIPGAKLFIRSGLDVNAAETELLASYLGVPEYDVKDLNVSPDGKRLAFAAHGGVRNATHRTWNIYLYDFENKTLQRIIKDDAIANAGNDTNPVFTSTGDIVFSSDRNAGVNPDPQVEEKCERVIPGSHPALLHSMNAEGENIQQLTFGTNIYDVKPTLLKDGRVAFIRWKTGFEPVSCASPVASSTLASVQSTSSVSELPSGLNEPPEWPRELRCAYSFVYSEQNVLIQNSYEILAINLDGNGLQQLYSQVSTSESDEAFLAPQKLYQSENGKMNLLLSHEQNKILGGALLELNSNKEDSSNAVFRAFSVSSLLSESIELYPEQLSNEGWYSAAWPYQDGTSRLLVSWAQCSTVSNGVNAFCSETSQAGDLDTQYGIWVFDPLKNSRSPIVRAEKDTVYTDIAMSQVKNVAAFPFDPIVTDGIENRDTSTAICDILPAKPPINEVPIANAGTDQSGIIGTTFNIDGALSSDPEGQVLSFNWRIIGKPETSELVLSEPTLTTFNLKPDVLGIYTLELVVSDQVSDSQPDRLVISVTEIPNAAPTAEAGGDMTGIIGSNFVLNASESLDPDGDSLSFEWSLLSQPMSSGLTMTSTAEKVTIKPDVLGDYVFELVVNDGKVTSNPDTVTVTVVAPPNTAPIANAGPDKTVIKDTPVILEGIGADADGDTLTYLWSIQSQPAGSSFVLSNPALPMPSFESSTVGRYEFALVTNDGQVSSSPDTVVITVIEPPNVRPIANAGDDQSGVSGNLFTLSGLNSSDADGDPLTYSWVLKTFPAGGAVSIVNSTSPTPQIQPNLVGRYDIELVVNDGKEDSLADSMTVTVEESPNQVPIANAGPDQSGEIMERFTLDGSASRDPDGDIITYQWTLLTKPAGSSIRLSDPATVNPSFVADVAGDYVIQLIVNDSQTNSLPDEIVITVDVGDNVKPVANAGVDQVATIGTLVNLNASLSFDPDSDPITYSWRVISEPTGSNVSLANPSQVDPSFVPTVLGDYEIGLIVNDGVLNSDEDSLIVSVVAAPNIAPISDAGPDQSGALGLTFTLDGSNSRDNDSDPLTYVWTLLSRPSGSGVNVNNPTNVSPTIMPDVAGDYVIQLIVNDGKVDSNADTVTISAIKGLNNKPVANAGYDQSVLIQSVVTLDASGSQDADGDSLTYAWVLIEKPLASLTTLNNADSVSPSFIPDEVGDYVVQLIVNDGVIDSDPDTVKVIAAVKPNGKPIANAGVDQTVNLQQKVILDGSASVDPDGDALIYDWKLVSQPAGANTELDKANSVMPEFIPSVIGQYVIQLIVNDGKINSDNDTVIVNAVKLPVSNRKPTADAGPDQIQNLGSTFTLDGSGSTDPEMATLTYRWVILSKPAGSLSSLVDSRSVNPKLIPDRLGDYIVQLIVNDGQLDSLPDTVKLTAVKPPNAKPLADAGRDQQGLINNVFTLDASGSSDPDNDSLTYQWLVIEKPGGSTENLSDASSVMPSFSADMVGRYVVQLIVNDGILDSDADTVVVTLVDEPNQKPVAEAGQDQTGYEGDTFRLDGSGSLDPDGDAITYQWTLISKPVNSKAILEQSQTMTPILKTDIAGTYRAQLIVNDGQVNSDADSVDIIAQAKPNKKPIADAGPDQQGVVNSRFDLTGLGSQDADGDPLTYQWKIISTPAASNAVLVNATTATPYVIADVIGEYQIELIINDGKVDSVPDTVKLIVIAKPNQLPVANAGYDQKVKRNQLVKLDGSGSFDADGDPLSYRWVVIAPLNSDITLSDNTSVMPEFIVGAFDSYEFQLIVNDGKADSAPDVVIITVNNVKPVAIAGPDQSLQPGDQALLDGSKSFDADGDTITYFWSFVEKPQDSKATLTANDVFNPSFTLDEYGQYKLQLIVNDGKVDSEPDYVIIDSENLQPIARAGNDQAVNVDTIVKLDGSGSFDPNGDPLTYRWQFISQPIGSTAVFIDDTDEKPQFKVDKPGEYVVQLIVNDGILDSQPDTVVVSTINLPPVANAGETRIIDTEMTVYLDGSKSFDPEGETLDYRWKIISQPDGSNATLKDANTVSPEFIPEVAGDYVAQLIVNDGQLDSLPDTVKISASAPPPKCDLSDATKRSVPVMIRDFKASHPDFEYVIGDDDEIVSNTLGSDGKPVYKNGWSGTLTTHNAFYFNQWYNACPGQNIEIPMTLTLSRAPGSTIWEYRNESFFPIDGLGWGNSGLTTPDRNYHFTLEMHLTFDYKGGEVFTFRGDDDLFLYINGKLAVNIGGVHPVIERTIDIDELAHDLGLEPGNTYSFDLFFAERHTYQSNFMMQTNMDLECVEPKK
ncbi:MAG: PKD domain-containing protein [Pseudomonadota bacterium]